MANETFQELLSEQKGKQDKEQVAISEAAQDFATNQQLRVTKNMAQKIKGYTDKSGTKIKPTVSREAISVVGKFQADLDSIADGSFSEFKDVMDKYQTLVGELDKSRTFNPDERAYVADIITPVLAEVRAEANAFTATRMGFKDLMKQFKPLKLAARVFGNIPILGKAIEKKIERTESGEQELRRAEVQKRKTEATGARKEALAEVENITGAAGFDEGDLMPEDSGFDEGPIVQRPVKTKSVIEEEREELSARRVAPFDTKVSKPTASDEEAKEEQIAIQEGWHEEDKNLFETIAENTEQTNILLEDFVKSGGDGDGGGFMKTAAMGGAGVAGVGATAYGAKRLLSNKKPSTLSSKAKTLAKGVTQKGSKVASAAGKVAKGAARVGSRLFLPLAAGLAIFDAATAVADAGELLGKEKEDLTLRDRASAGAGGLVDFLSFGLLQKEKVAKFLAGEPSEQDKVEKIAPVENSTKPLIYGADNITIDSKRTMVRAHLETSSLENTIEKLFPKNNTGNDKSVITTVNSVANANSTNLWPDMSNINIDQTVNDIKKTY